MEVQTDLETNFLTSAQGKRTTEDSTQLRSGDEGPGENGDFAARQAEDVERRGAQIVSSNDFHEPIVQPPVYTQA